MPAEQMGRGGGAWPPILRLRNDWSELELIKISYKSMLLDPGTKNNLCTKLFLSVPRMSLSFCQPCCYAQKQVIYLFVVLW